MSDPDYSDPAIAIDKAVNTSGYALAHSAFAHAWQLFNKGKSDWIFEASEFPYAVGGRDGRVDLVLKHRDVPVYLCLEFKRTDPLYRRWVFARGGSSRRDRSDEYPFLDGVLVPVVGMPVVRGYEILSSLPEAYTVALVAPGEREKKGWKPGDSEFEATASQAYAGSIGLLQHIARHRLSVPQNEVCYVVPVIVTTAPLFVIQTLLTTADLATGTMNIGSHNIAERDMLYYQYPGSPGIRPTDHSFLASGTSAGSLLDAAYIRTIPVMSSRALEHGLAQLSNWARAQKSISGSY